MDLVSSGKTLKAHHLVELDVIAESTARLIVNRASLKLKHQAITDLTARLKGVGARNAMEDGHRRAKGTRARSFGRAGAESRS